MLYDPDYQRFIKDFTERFNQFKKEGKLQGVTLARWADALPERPHEGLAYFAMPLKNDPNYELPLRFNYQQIDRYYNGVGNESEKDRYINGSLNELNSILNRMKEDDNK